MTWVSIVGLHVYACMFRYLTCLHLICFNVAGDDSSRRSGQHDTCIKLIAEVILQQKQLLQKLQIENDQLKEKRPRMTADQLETDANVLFFTGLPSLAMFTWLVNFLSSVLPASELLNSADMLLLVIMKLRLNVPHKDLAF